MFLVPVSLGAGNPLSDAHFGTLAYCLAAGATGGYREGSGEAGYNYASEAHSFDYKIGDGHGGIDGRVGIKLGEPRVQVLQEFEKPAEPSVPPAEEEAEAGRKKRHTIVTMPVMLGKRLNAIGRKRSAPPKRALKRPETIQILADQLFQRV
ncbi:MAG TPA: hypothetical protein VFB12_10550 [Ktedonobacteraceae bacterium]|nr:hypothetical protein [Ktedonobacteraceae bacterium]